MAPMTKLDPIFFFMSAENPERHVNVGLQCSAVIQEKVETFTGINRNKHNLFPRLSSADISNTNYTMTFGLN